MFEFKEIKGPRGKQSKQRPIFGIYEETKIRSCVNIELPVFALDRIRVINLLGTVWKRFNHPPFGCDLIEMKYNK